MRVVKLFPCSVELNYSKKLLDKIQGENIKNRTENILIWYQTKAKSNKILYYIVMVTSILCSAIIPILSLSSDVDWRDIIVSVIAALGGLVTSISTLFHFKDNWHRYRTYAEKLKSECFKYVNKSQEYHGKNSTEADELFMKTLEEIALEENKVWLDERRTVRNAESGE